MIIYLRFFIGCLAQLAPFALLTLFPLRDCYRLSSKKTCRIITALLTTISALFAAFCLYLYNSQMNASDRSLLVNGVFLICIIPCLFIYLFLTRTSWQRKIFTFSFVMVIAFIITYTCNIISTWLLHNNGVYDGLPYRSYSLLVLVCTTLVFCPILYIIIKKAYLPIANKIDSVGYGIMSIVSILLFALLFGGLILIDIENIYNPLTLFLFLTLIFSVCFIYFMMFRLLVLTHDNILNKAHYEFLNNSLEIQREQYKNLSDSIDTVRELKHNFKYDLLYIAEKIHDNESQKALSKIHEYISDLDNTELIRFSRNKAIDAVIGYYNQLGRNSGINMLINITDFDSGSIDSSDLAVLLGNLLDNAVTAAAAQPKDPFVKLSMAVSGNMLAITLDNSYSGELKPNGNEYPSTKKNHTAIGLKSIAEIAHKYNGDSVFSHDGKAFHASVLLHLQ